ncbi:MAG TPA: hypothetical protein DIW21_04840 [Enterococcus sp.]|nr:hypothetical protein [Enterococcus sp.]
MFTNEELVKEINALSDKLSEYQASFDSFEDGERLLEDFELAVVLAKTCYLKFYQEQEKSDA